MPKFPFFKQLDSMDCGPTCLRMVAKYYGRNIKIQLLRKYCEISKTGVSLLGISRAAEKIGFRSFGIQCPLVKLNEVELPAIIHWHSGHFVVLYKVKHEKYFIADPISGLKVIEKREFASSWLQTADGDNGIILLLAPTPEFYDDDQNEEKKLTWVYLLRYLLKYKKLLGQLFIGLVMGSLLQLVAPFLTQSIIDVGVNTQNLNFIYLILIAQIILVISKLTIEFVRSWILLHISTRVNVSILTDFLIKLMKLPMSFFDSKMTGDILQRMEDQKKIENFLTGSTLNTLFSLFNLIIFSIVLVYYNPLIFLVFLVSSILYSLWIMLFMKKRRDLNYKSFKILASNQSSIVQLIAGMQEIKLNNSEQQKRWYWEQIQAKLFKFKVSTLSLNQYQQGGSSLINEGSNIIIIFLCAKSVIEGQLTLGEMVAVQYIIGQLNLPVLQLLGLIQTYQDAKISMERLNEINQTDEEEDTRKEWIYKLPDDKSITLSNVTFHYPGSFQYPVLKNLNLKIPEGKITAIVGMSGSGKTTILKLLLRFYDIQGGEILIGNTKIDLFSHRMWRSKCGTVMQDGFIFSDTIENNIAIGEEFPNEDKLWEAVRLSNLSDLVEKLPMGLKTIVGAEGSGISQGQRQRILIARAVYKNPEYLFFDEATNALDSKNERTIMENLSEFFQARTVVIVAHRLSTVKNADNIIVLDKNGIVEEGDHSYLTSLKGSYYELVKNQLELEL